MPCFSRARRVHAAARFWRAFDDPGFVLAHDLISAGDPEGRRGVLGFNGCQPGDFAWRVLNCSIRAWRWAWACDRWCDRGDAGDVGGDHCA